MQTLNGGGVLGPLCYGLVTIVNCYLEAGLTCFVYCPKALYLIIFDFCKLALTPVEKMSVGYCMDNILLRKRSSHHVTIASLLLLKEA